MIDLPKLQEHVDSALGHLVALADDLRATMGLIEQDDDSSELATKLTAELTALNVSVKALAWLAVYQAGAEVLTPEMFGESDDGER